MPAASDLCTAATVAADLAVPVDAAVARCVSAASRAIARFCGRAFELATVTEHPASYGRPYLLLARPPLVAVSSVLERGELLDPDGYTIAGELAEGGLVYRLAGLWPDTAHSGGIVSTTAELRQGRPDVLSVTYSGGYVTPGQVELGHSGPVTLPADVEEAAILEACALYRGRGRDVDVASEGLGDWSVSYRERAEGQRLASPRAELLLATHILRRAS